MANTSSAKKAARQAVRRTAVNRMRRSFVRTAVKKVEAMVAAGDRDGALEALKAAEPALMRAAQRGVVERNTASRKVSRLVHQVRRIGA